MTGTDDEIYGLYHGAAFSDETLSGYVWNKFRHRAEELGGQERDLGLSKWYDYRLISYARATLVYAGAYDRVLRILYARHFDRSSAKHIKADWLQDKAIAAHGGNIFKGRSDVLTGLWKGRQFADAIGMPYELYIETAMERGMRIKRSHMPRPQHLYSRDIVDHCADVWAERCKSVLMVGEHSTFRNANYAGLPHQKDHHTWLIEQVQLRGGSPHTLADLIFKRELLPLEVATEHFSGPRIERAKEIASD